MGRLEDARSYQRPTLPFPQLPGALNLQDDIKKFDFDSGSWVSKQHNLGIVGFDVSNENATEASRVDLDASIPLWKPWRNTNYNDFAPDDDGKLKDGDADLVEDDDPEEYAANGENEED
jgi:hypothetical protein